MTEYRGVSSWADRRAQEGDVRGDPRPAMRHTPLDTAGARKARAITATSQGAWRYLVPEGRLRRRALG